MRSFLMIMALVCGLGSAPAQMAQDPALAARLAADASSVAPIDWGAGFASVLPGELARRADAAPYRSELLEAMAEYVRCVDAQDAGAAAARARVVELMRAHPEQLNDVATSADGKWVCSPYTMALYLNDPLLEAELVKHGALPYLPALTLFHPSEGYTSERAAVRKSPHALRGAELIAFAGLTTRPTGIPYGELELYLQARAAGVSIRQDGAAQEPPPAAARRAPHELLPMQEAPFTVPLLYVFTPGDLARRASAEVYHSELIKAFIIMLREASSRQKGDDAAPLKGRALLEREIREHPEQVNDVYEYAGECCDDSPYGPVEMCLWDGGSPEILELLFAHGALPFAAAGWIIPSDCGERVVARIMQERRLYISPLEAALQARARGVNVLPYASERERLRSLRYTVAYEGDAFYEVPAGMHRPAAAPAK